jgi:guanylate kinase
MTREANKKPELPGNLFIISAPSGGGKTTLCKALLKRMPEMAYSISYTTRKLRRGEKDGVDYHFITDAAFKHRMAQGRWCEWAKVHDHFYGTDAGSVEQTISGGQDLLLDIDVQGTRQMIHRYPKCITIFIEPPSMDILKVRLQRRGTDSYETIEKRLINAEKEMAQKDLYCHVIINDVLEMALKELKTLIEEYRIGVRGLSQKKEDHKR